MENKGNIFEIKVSQRKINWFVKKKKLDENRKIP